MTRNAKTQIHQMATAYLLSRAIYAAAELGIADFIQDQPVSVKRLAALADTDPQSLYRLLRMLASHGIFEESPTGHFALTPMAECLRSDDENSIRDVLLSEDETRWNAIGRLDLAVKQGVPAFDLLYGENYFEYLSKHPEKSSRFDAHMTQLTRDEDRLIAEAFDIGPANTIADIGGGRGGFLAQLLQKHPNSMGILFDLPIVFQREDKLLLNEVRNRCKIIPGNFFESVPFSADVLMLKRVLHDWDDNACRKILKNCREAMSHKSRLYIVEAIVPEGNEPHVSKDADVFLMAIFSGKERTREEFSVLLRSEGLEVKRVLPTKSYMSIIETTLHD